jgi:hypothetical protein
MIAGAIVLPSISASDWVTKTTPASVSAYLGIELGQQWKPEKVNPLVLKQMKLAAQEVGPMMNLTAPLAGKPSNGWDIPPPGFGAPRADYFLRGINAVLGLTGNTTTEAIYYLGGVDACHIKPCNALVRQWAVKRTCRRRHMRRRSNLN